MSTYQIADLEQLSGIKAHTIRIWEKRYGIITPNRTSSNIRFYDDDQAKKLLKISTLLGLGIKISKIAMLSDKEINQKVLEAQASENNDIVSDGYINDLISAMLTFDENEFERTFSNAVVKFGMFKAMVNVFYPFLKKTGVMWSMAETMPVQEHFATSIIRRKLISAIDGLQIPTKRSKKFLLFLPPDEWHETGLLFAEFILRSNGYKTIYLGQNVPLDNLKEVVKAASPTHIFTLYITRQDQDKIQRELKSLSSSYPTLKILISASPMLKPLLNGNKKLQFLMEPSDLQKIL